jgi:hypothetical protein
MCKPSAQVESFFSEPAPLPPHFAHVACETRRLAAVWWIVGAVEEVRNLRPLAMKEIN